MRYNDKKRRITMADVSNFTINIESIIDSKDAMHHFVKFLYDTKNSENANFLKDIGEFGDICHDKSRKDKADYIIATYIKENSPQELNINSDIRSSIINYDNCRKNMFDQLKNHILSSMNDHIFPLFLRSKLFTSFIESSTLYTLYQIGSVNNSTLLYYIDKLDNLRDEYVTWNDVQFIESQTLDSMDGWKIIKNGGHYKCLYSKNSYNIGDSSGLNFFKYYIDIDCDVETCLSIFKESKYRLMLDGNIVSIDNIAYLTPKTNNQLYTAISREEYKIIYPYENREFIVSTSGIRKDNKIIIIMKTSCYDTPSKNKTIRCPSVGGWIFEDVGNGKTRYCQFHCVDFRMSIPNGIIKMLLKKRARQFYVKSKNIIEKLASTQYVSIMDNNIGKTIFDNSDKVSQYPII